MCSREGNLTFQWRMLLPLLIHLNSLLSLVLLSPFAQHHRSLEPNQLLFFYRYLWSNLVLKQINFYEHMRSGSSYGPMLYVSQIVCLIIITIWAYLHHKRSSGTNLLSNMTFKKIVNSLFYALGKILSGPLLGLAINVLYCD